MAIRLGAEDKKKRIMAMVLVSLALSLIAHTVWQLASGSSTPSAVLPPATTAPISEARTTASGSHAAVHLESASALDPTLHPERMALAENTKYSGTSRNIFSKDSLPPVPMNTANIEKPIGPVRTGPVVPPGPPPPPPIDLKFYGFATGQNGSKQVFLLHGEDLFVAGKGDIVEGRYKVVDIDSDSIVVEDLSYKNRQTLALQT